MNRRNLLKGLFALPFAAAAAPLAAIGFAEGGVVSDPSPYLIGEQPTEGMVPIDIPVRITQVNASPKSIGTLTIDVHCDAEELQRSMDKCMKHALRQMARRNRSF